MHLCVTPERLEKTKRIMAALAAGGCGRVCFGHPRRHEPFVVWGHLLLAEKIVPRAMQDGTEWWLVDNGWHRPANGGAEGYYSLTLGGTAPQMLPDTDRMRLPVEMKPWRRDGETVLIAMPGVHFGRMMGIDTAGWRRSIVDRVRAVTSLPIVVREKDCKRTLAEDLAGAHVLVTHSSKAAVAAVIAGVPAIVEPSSSAAPMAGTSLAEIENPPRPDGREAWWASLMAQQFTLDEMRNGTAKRGMDAVKEHADGLGKVQQGFPLETDIAVDGLL